MARNPNIDDDTRARAMKFVEDADMRKPAVTANSKQRVVSKKELEDSGMSLRDFLNKERGLTRREDKSMSKAAAEKQLGMGEKPSKEAVSSAKAQLGLESPAAAPTTPSTDVTKMSLAERARMSRDRARSGSTTDTRSVGERIRSALGGKDRGEETIEPDSSGIGMKRGGKVKKMASGGSASKRADGIASKGKTRGKMV
jgi:hypothetical protein